MVESRQKAAFTEKITIKDREIGAGQTIEEPLALSNLRLFAYEQGIKVVAGYPQNESPKPVPAADFLSPAARARQSPT